MVYTLRFFSLKCSLCHNSNLFGSCIIHILYTECAKIKKIIPAQKVKPVFLKLLELQPGLGQHIFLATPGGRHKCRCKIIIIKKHYFWLRFSHLKYLVKPKFSAATVMGFMSSLSLHYRVNWNLRIFLAVPQSKKISPTIM